MLFWNHMRMRAAKAGFQIQRSLRFRGSAAAYLNRTFAAGNQSTWTMSFWLKRSTLGLQNVMQAGGAGGSVIYIGNDDALHLSLTIGSGETRVTSALFRDPTSWYHIVVSLDTTQATAANRVTITVNGVVQTSFSTSADPVLNSTFSFNGATGHTIGQATAQVGGPLDGYVTSAILVSGQQLPASSFGEFSTNGQWRPKTYSGSYGTTGFNLSFADPTNLTTLASDSSGNGNNWTANNVSLTAGTTYDSMLDVPLGGGGNERGNYATLNPLHAGGAAPTNGSLSATSNSSSYKGFKATQAIQYDAYWEVTVVNRTAVVSIGVANTDWLLGLAAGSYFYHYDGGKYLGGTNTVYGAAFTTGDVIGFTYAVSTGTVTCYKNNVSQGVLTSGLSGNIFPAGTLYDTNDCAYNFGQRPFTYTPPNGFKALHTDNLVNVTPTASGSFTGNALADGPVVWVNGAPETLTINGNSVTWGTHADRTAGGFKLRTGSTSYNASGTNTWAATFLSPSSNSAFKYQLAKANP